MRTVLNHGLQASVIALIDMQAVSVTTLASFMHLYLAYYSYTCNHAITCGPIHI